MSSVNFCERYFAGQEEFAKKPPQKEREKQPPFDTPKKSSDGDKNFHNPPISPSFDTSLITNLLKDGDKVLILGILLLLMGEDADKFLLIALIYILL